MIHVWKTYARQHPRFGVWYQRVERQPSWVVKTAVVAAVLVVGVPLMLLTVTAVIAGVLVGGALGVLAGAVYKVRRMVRRWSTGAGSPEVPEPRDDGRRNVRVIQTR